MITYGASQILNLLAPFLVGIYVIPIVGLANWGIIGVATAWYVLLGILIEFGANLVGVKEISTFLHKKQYIKTYLNSVYTFRAYITIIITVMLLLLFWILSVDISYYFGLIWMLAWYFNPLWVYQAKQDFKALNTTIILSKIVYLVLVYFVVKTKQDYIYVVSLLGLSNAVIYGFSYYKLNVKLLSFKRAVIIFNVNKTIVLSNFAINAYTQAPVFIIDAVLGNTFSGIYKVIDLFITAFRSYLGVFFNVTFPKLCSVIASDFTKGKLYSKRMSVYNLIFLVLITSIVFIATPYILNYFNVSQEINKGFALSRYLLFLPLIIAANIPFYQMLLYQNENKKVVQVSIIGLFLTLILGFTLTNYFALLGTIISLYIVELYITISLMGYSKKYFKS